MATPSKEKRDQRLENLVQATEMWAKKEKKYFEDQSELLKELMRGRTGSERLAHVSVETASDFTVDAINQFLTGD